MALGTEVGFLWRYCYASLVTPGSVNRRCDLANEIACLAPNSADGRALSLRYDFNLYDKRDSQQGTVVKLKLAVPSLD